MNDVEAGIRRMVKAKGVSVTRLGSVKNGNRISIISQTASASLKCARRTPQENVAGILEERANDFHPSILADCSVMPETR